MVDPCVCWVRSSQHPVDAQRRLAHALSVCVLPARRRAVAVCAALGQGAPGRPRRRAGAGLEEGERYVCTYVCMLYASPLPYIQCPELSYYLLITHYYRYKESGFHCRGGGILYECIYCMYVFANYMLLLLLHCEVRPSKSSLVTIPPHLFTVCFEAVAVDHSPSTAPENRPGYPPPVPSPILSA